MTAAPAEPPTPATMPPRRLTLTVVELPRPREDRGPAPTSPVVAAARARLAECARGAHVWTDVGDRPRVCLHCPIPEDQAERVRAAHRARAAA